METSSNTRQNRLVERMVRNDSIFCSLLFDRANRTLRVVDFRGGNFQSKHNYLEQVLVAEGMRKIFTLIERDDMNGWQRVGYHKEGSIPGYYKRSDGYIMARSYDMEVAEKATPKNEETSENKKLLNDIKTLGQDISEQKSPSIQLSQVTEGEALKAVEKEFARVNAKAKKAKKKKKPAIGSVSVLAESPPIFPQFSREVEHFYFVAQNRRTKQANVIGAEYQDCFGNAKIQCYFYPESKPDQNIAKEGLRRSIDALEAVGAVSLFAIERADNVVLNAVYASLGFRNTGWMNHQLLTKDGPVDSILWTRKLI